MALSATSCASRTRLAPLPLSPMVSLGATASMIGHTISGRIRAPRNEEDKISIGDSILKLEKLTPSNLPLNTTDIPDFKMVPLNFAPEKSPRRVPSVAPEKSALRNDPPSVEVTTAFLNEALLKLPCTVDFPLYRSNLPPCPAKLNVFARTRWPHASAKRRPFFPPTMLVARTSALPKDLVTIST